ncbi:MAG TPA: ABC transporter [Gammaproteobacteria bacterium]|nr:ABC transporter [Gammaproteobacteria bacterium]HCO58594.1 ABC transporter [Porticoccaceae bacterium]
MLQPGERITNHLPAEAVLTAKHVSKTVAGPGGELTILDCVDLEISAGEVVAITGPSGSGKSTLLGILAGLDLPSEGAVQLLGHALVGSDEDERAAIRAGKVGFVFQSFQLLPSFTALENVMLPMELAGLPNTRQQAQDILQRIGLMDRAAHYPAQLSGGEQQRVALARAFAVKPRILFADEPTGNLDGATGARVVQQMFDLRDELGTTLVLVTHDAQLASRCDKRYEMISGRLMAA